MQETSKQLKEMNQSNNMELGLKRFYDAQKINTDAIVKYKYSITAVIMLSILVGLVAIYQPIHLKYIIACALIIICTIIPMNLNQKK